MSQRDGFAGGFILGAMIGGAIGGIVGALAASKRSISNPDTLPANEEEMLHSAAKSERIEKSAEQSIEMARRSLEAKIAQLNLAIDDVRQQLSTPVSHENGDRE
ncbi:MAG: hypothetical protein J7647_07730 [Cyanobacteria bacterium SBLK]|nr:hypothetical protein [Cyanobacteria bacterium SBLK]